VAKKRVGRFPKAFRQMAVDRLNQCENIVVLAKELGISRRLLYTWREKLEPRSSGEGPAGMSREATLRHITFQCDIRIELKLHSVLRLSRPNRSELIPWSPKRR
jgi:transposase-like protein